MALLLHGCKDTKPSLEATCASKPPRLLSCSNLNASGLKNLKASVPPPLLSSFWKVPWRPCVELAEPLMEVAWVSESLRGRDPLPILHKREKSSLLWSLWDFRAYLLLSRASLSWRIQLPDHYVPAVCWVLRVDGIVNHSPPLRNQPMAQSYWAITQSDGFLNRWPGWTSNLRPINTTERPCCHIWEELLPRHC